MGNYLVTAHDEFTGQQVVIAKYENVKDEQTAKEKAVQNFNNLDINDLVTYELK